MNPASKKLRWGVLGWARIATAEVIPAIGRSSNCRLQAVASRDAAKLEACRKQYPEVTTHLGYAKLLEDPEVDAVYNPLPNSQHCEWTIRAAERGKHILCEKPMGLDAAECRRMIDACVANRVVLMEAFMYRYSDRTRQVLEVIRSGALGEIRFIAASFRFHLANPASIKLKPDLGGGCLYDVGCYPVNFVGMVADAAGGGGPASAKPVSVAAECVREGGVDMIFSAVLRYPSGLVASINSGFNSQRRVFSEIVGAKGLLEVPETFFGLSGALTLTTEAGVTAVPVEESDRYRLEVEDFADAVFAGRPPLFPLSETMRNAEVIDRLFAAANNA